MGQVINVSRMVDAAKKLGGAKVAAAYPCDQVSLGAVVEGKKLGLMDPIAVGPKSKIEAVAEENGFSLDGIIIEDIADSRACAARAAAMARDGQVAALMKGSLHTDELMGAVVARDAGLRTSRRVSHCFVMETPHCERPFIITDAVVNIAPDLKSKADIVRNSIDVARAIGIETPKIAILAAVETVNFDMPTTLDAAALCKMADRGQIQGAIIDGPLALDNAVSATACSIKKIKTPLEGRADVLMVPNLESGNILFKGLGYLGGGKLAGVVVGAKVPVILTSRADSAETRVASCALAALLAHQLRRN